jgi:hypothetical protein
MLDPLSWQFTNISLKTHQIKWLSMSFQNFDGGFGNALEPDFFNPNSSPIATNDAIITLYRVNALNKDSDIVKGIVR